MPNATSLLFITRSTSFVASAILFFCLSSQGNAQSSKSLAQRQKDQEVYIKIKDTPYSLDVNKQIDQTSGSVMGHIYEGLMTYDAKGELTLGTASRINVSPEGKVYTFSIRPDAKWHDGKPVTAHDFVNSFRRLVTPEYGSYYSSTAVTAQILNAADIISRKKPVADLGVKAIDNFTLEIQLSRPVAFFPSLMAMSIFFPVRLDIIKKFGTKYALEKESLIGNGPFRIADLRLEHGLRLEKAKTYWNAKAIKLNAIEMTVIKDLGSAYNMFATNNLDMVDYADAERLALGTQDKKKIEYFSDSFVFYLLLNPISQRVFAHPKLRQAIRFGINRREFVNKVEALPGQHAAFGIISDTMPGSKPNSTYRKEAPMSWVDGDVVKAKKLVKEYLAETKQSKVPSFTITATDTNTMRNEAEYLADAMRKILDTDIKMKFIPSKTCIQKLADKDFDVVFSGWGADYNDPITYLDIWLPGGENNDISYNDPKYAELIEKARSSNDKAERVKLFQEAEKLFIEFAGVIPIYQRSVVRILQNGLVGVRKKPMAPSPDLRYAHWENTRSSQ